MTLVLRFLLIVAAFAVGITNAHAHAFGERYDLPVPLWMNLAGGSAVPEPASLGLVSLGALAFVGRRSRRRTPGKN